MEKIKIKSLSKTSFRSKYVFPKQQKFFKIFRKVLTNLKIKEANVLGAYYDEKDEQHILEKEEKISTYHETIDHFENKQYSVEIIYFSDSIHVIFNSKRDKQQEISNILEKYIKD
ncbi:hypothetical protein HOD29_07340 [archaeon]|jgi:hypothetical protein|nr:hypothetical protein [archaeon]